MSFWRTIELFSPQPVPARTRRATRPPDRQVIEWQRDDPLPWNALRPPGPLYGQPRVWRHRVYLGVYKIEATYESLQRVFGQDPDAYDESPRGESACAGVLIDHDGCVVTDSAVLSSALWGIGRSYNPGPRDSDWMEGFEVALAAFAEEVDRLRRHTAGGARCTGGAGS